MRVYCPHCGAALLPRDYPAHVRAAHDRPGYICVPCGQPFASERELAAHRTLAHRTPAQVVVVAPVSPQQTQAAIEFLREAGRRHRDEQAGRVVEGHAPVVPQPAPAPRPRIGGRTCAICGFVAKTPRGLLVHRGWRHRVTERRPIIWRDQAAICPDCGREFENARGVARHRGAKHKERV